MSDARKSGGVSGAQRKAARALEKAAKDAEAVGGWLPHGQRLARDRAVRAARAVGRPQKEVAAEWGISVAQVRRIERGEVVESPREQPPLELVDELLRDYRDAVATFTAMAADFYARKPSAAVQALRQAVYTTERMLLMLNALGVLPSNLRLLRSEAEQRRVGVEMRGVLESLMREEISPREAYEAWVRLLPVDVSARELAA